MNKTIIHTPKAPEPIGPYSQAIYKNGTLYVSGQIALNSSSGELVTGNISLETHQVMKNIQAVLDAADLTFEHVVKCSIFCRNLEDFPLINEAYSLYFGDDAPARETVEVSRLPKNVNVEISCIAVA
ncbi:RidA family protein [Nafulsella turpanensis]|uniref:RidA family protein n=1 Tax=Nafulsella turpanensis TaxID=1265690 RepID=UPI0003494E64|nr:RidA family protein [Nafulsella turpanensis]